MLKIGDVVKVIDGSGIDSGKTGQIINYDAVETDGRGVPNLPGHYKPIDRSKEFLVIYLDGTMNTMFKNRLKKL